MSDQLPAGRHMQNLICRAGLYGLTLDGTAGVRTVRSGAYAA